MSNIVRYRDNGDELLRNVIRGHLSYRHNISLNEALLIEGISGGVVKDAVQFVASAGAEYGLGALTLPAAGSGLAVGPTVETMVDAAFAAEEVAGTIDAVANIGNKLGEYGTLWNEARSSYGGDLDAYYKTLVKIVRQALNDLGEKAEGKVEDIANKLQGAIEKLISRLVGALKSGIKLVIPDATIGLAAAKAFEEGLETLSENAFDLLAGAVSKVKMLKDFVSNPSIAVDFFKDVFAQVVELMAAGAKKLEDMSWIKAIMAGGVAGGAALKKLGPAGLEKAAGLLKDKTPAIIKVIDGVLTILVPTAITAVGLFQILMNDDWKEEEDNEKTSSAEKNEKEKLAASFNIRGTNNMLISKSRLRKVIRESLIIKEAHQTIIQNPYEDVDDYNVLANYALTGDIAGALADPALKYYVDKNEMGWIADEAIGWFNNVGKEGPAPEGWDKKKAHQFLKDIEDAAYKEYDKMATAAIAGDPDKEFLEFLGNQWTSQIEPNDLPDIKWKEYKKYVRLKPPRSISHGVGEINISKEDINSLYSGAYDDFIDFLTTRTAGQLGRRAPYKRSPAPYYD